MKTAISVKELRMNFPAIRKKLEQGEGFTVIYRSKPLAQLLPVSPDIIEPKSAQFGKGLNEKICELPKSMEDFLKNIDKYTLKGGKQFDVVKELRKDRGYDD